MWPAVNSANKPGTATLLVALGDRRFPCRRRPTTGLTPDRSPRAASGGYPCSWPPPPAPEPLRQSASDPCTIPWAIRSATAAMVSDGFTAKGPGMTAPSAT
jgi:hypothetical protein